MPIDPNIALQVRPMQIENPLNLFAKYQELSANKMKMDEYKAGVTERNALAQLVTQPGFDPTKPENQNAILRVAPTTGPAILKSLTETRAAGVDLKNKELDLKTKQIDKALKDITAYTSAEDTLAGIQRHLEAGDIDQAKAAALVQSLQAAPSFEAWQMGAVRGLLDAKDRLAQTFTNQDLGGTTRQIATPTYGGGPARVVEGSVGTKTMTPGDVQQAADSAASRNLQRERMNKEFGENVVASTTTSADGTVHHFNKFGQEIGQGKPGAGKPSATFEKTAAQRKQLNLDLDSTISELEKATKPGGLIEKATGSGAGALRDVAAGFFGKATEGSVAIGALAPIYDKVLKMVPRFEGPQSDKDTQSYRDAAGNLANPNTPTDVKLAAAKEILRLMKARKNQFLTRDMAEGGSVVADGVDTNNPFLK